MLAHAASHRVDGYALLGDFVGYGADPAWVVDKARELVAAGAVAVQGNHDEATVQGASPGMRPEPRQVIDWTRAQLDAAQLDFLQRLPLEVHRGDVLYVHANAWDPPGWEYVMSRGDAARSIAAAAAVARVTFCGHMHEPALYRMADDGRVWEHAPPSGDVTALRSPSRWLVVPGSVGQPRDGDPAACYAIHDDAAATVTYWRVPYDHPAAAAKVLAAGLPVALAERLVLGL